MDSAKVAMPNSASVTKIKSPATIPNDAAIPQGKPRAAELTTTKATLPLGNAASSNITAKNVISPKPPIPGT